MMTLSMRGGRSSLNAHDWISHMSARPHSAATVYRREKRPHNYHHLWKNSHRLTSQNFRTLLRTAFVSCGSRLGMLVVALLGVPSFSSTLLGTTWRLKLDVGLEPGSWMPKIVDGWGSSGARVCVDAKVSFDSAPAAEHEELLGPLEQTRVLTACGGGKIITFDGEQEVTFESGGWCVQRPLFTTSARHEGLLRFWLDCPSGCAKNDVSVPPGERIFFSTGVWDDAQGIQSLRTAAAVASEQLRALEAEDDLAVPSGDLLSRIPVLGPMRRQVLRSERSATLRSTCAYHSSWPGLNDETRLALIASGGSLSLKRQRPRGYIYLGKFEAEPLAAE